MTRNEAFTAFGWQRVRDCMAEKPRWRWTDSNGVPSVQELIKAALCLADEMHISESNYFIGWAHS